MTIMEFFNYLIAGSLTIIVVSCTIFFVGLMIVVGIGVLEQFRGRDD